MPYNYDIKEQLHFDTEEEVDEFMKDKDPKEWKPKQEKGKWKVFHIIWKVTEKYLEHMKSVIIDFFENTSFDDRTIDY